MAKKLPVTEELDFAYLLGLMRPLHNVEEYAWLPELFSLVGYESILNLCKYAGGYTIKIPTLEELVDSLLALQGFYDVYIKKTKALDDLDEGIDKQLVIRIKAIYDARNSKISNL